MDNKEVKKIPTWAIIIGILMLISAVFAVMDKFNEWSNNYDKIERSKIENLKKYIPKVRQEVQDIAKTKFSKEYSLNGDNFDTYFSADRMDEKLLAPASKALMLLDHKLDLGYVDTARVLEEVQTYIEPLQRNPKLAICYTAFQHAEAATKLYFDKKELAANQKKQQYETDVTQCFNSLTFFEKEAYFLVKANRDITEKPLSYCYLQISLDNKPYNQWKCVLDLNIDQRELN